MTHPTKPGLVTVPVHAGKTLPPGTLSNILKQTGLTADEFRRLLREAYPADPSGRVVMPFRRIFAVAHKPVS